jgi:hypothetical protein
VRTKELTKSPMSTEAVSVAIVLGVQESCIHGEGPHRKRQSKYDISHGTRKLSLVYSGEVRGKERTEGFFWGRRMR